MGPAPGDLGGPAHSSSRPLGWAASGQRAQVHLPRPRGAPAHTGITGAVSAGSCLCVERVNIFVYFTILYIFIGYFYQGFSRSHLSIFCNQFRVRGSLACSCKPEPHRLLSARDHLRPLALTTSDLRSCMAPSSPQVASGATCSHADSCSHSS